MTTKTDMLKAIRLKCLDCSVYQLEEVRLCPARACALWPYRMGRDPHPTRKGNIGNLPSRRGEIDGKADMGIPITGDG